MFNLLPFPAVILIFFSSMANAGEVCELTRTSNLLSLMNPSAHLSQGDKKHGYVPALHKDGVIMPLFHKEFNELIEKWKTLAAEGVCPNGPVSQNQCKIVPTGMKTYGIAVNSGQPFFIFHEPEIVRQTYDKLVDIGFCAGHDSKKGIQISDPCKLSHYYDIVPGIQLLQGEKELIATTLGKGQEANAGQPFSYIMDEWRRLFQAGVCPNNPDEMPAVCKIINTSETHSDPHYYPNTWGVSFNNSDPFFISKSEEKAFQIIESLKNKGLCPNQPTQLVAIPTKKPLGRKYYPMGDKLKEYKEALITAVEGHKNKFKCERVQDQDTVGMLLNQISSATSGTIESVANGNETKETLVFEYPNVLDEAGNFLAFYRVDLPLRKTDVLSITAGVYQNIPKDSDYPAAAEGSLRPRILNVCRVKK